MLLQLVTTLIVNALPPAELPLPEHGLHFEEPAATWDEAMPLGNGILGALVWGSCDPLTISLDRTDLWDLRPVPEYHSEDYDYRRMREWEAQGETERLLKLYDEPYHRPAPTKIPAGRINLTLGGHVFQQADLDLKDAVVTTQFDGDVAVRVWIHAAEAVGNIEVTGTSDVRAALEVPPFGGMAEGPAKPAISMGDLAQLGYPPPVEDAGKNWVSYRQEGWGGFHFAGYLAWRADTKGWRACWSVASSAEGDDPLALAKGRAEDALSASTRDQMQSHRAWWHRYWQQASIRVPNPIIERQWYLDTYKFGAASRRGAPPITLQGPWTADNGQLPPWKGDYHHDLNTELSYWPCYSGNHLEEGLSFLDWLWDTRKNCEDWTQRFFKMPGMNVPMTADLNNNPIGGWRQYTHSSTTACWIAHHFYLHALYSADATFVRERAYPYLTACAAFIEAVTNERDADGKRTLPLSSSPEINDNRPEAWFPTITNYDLALIRWLLTATAELADRVDERGRATHWRSVLDEMPDLALAEDGSLLVAKDYPLTESHRHFSHVMAFHPLGLIDWANGEEDQRIIRASLDQLDRLGTDYWTGYSFAWLANMAARARDGEAAAEALELFAKNFVLQSSFHCNGDQSGEGYSKFTYRPFTLEGNFASATGLQEMLLQSHSGVIRVFPAVPRAWKDVAFRRLRAQGAFLVSATQSDGVVVDLRIHAERGGRCRLLHPETGETIAFVLDPGETRQLIPAP